MKDTANIIKFQPLSGQRCSRCFMTLMEVLVACMVSGLAVSGALGVLKQGLWGTDYLRDRSTAIDIAKNRLEQLRSGAYVDLAMMSEHDLPVNSEGIPDSEGRFLRSTTVGEDTGNSRAVTVTVKTGWGPGDEPLVVSLGSILVDKTKFQYRMTYQ